ncbi:MAG: hypothetical protein HPY79_12270 [Bacteroidales bacterium]|jgi:hypothetical protein|nr:hypothetical protein [Bacteroidales bacterium]
MGIADKVDEILEESNEVRKKEITSSIELFMNWLFSNYEFRLNMLSLKPEFRPVGSQSEYKELDDQNYNTISILAEINGFSKSMVEKMQRIILSAYVPSVNEIADFFTKIEPLGNDVHSSGNFYHMPTVKAYFDCLELADNTNKDLIYNIYSRWVVASVNSALGIKHNDVMLILSGSQGIYKTSYLNNLIPAELGKEKYLVTGHIDPALTNQNTANYLCEKFIINIDDQLEVIFGKEYNSMKAIISIDRVTSRRVYAKFDRTRKRIANFVGSVNSNEFLTDNQNRRYFVIEVTGISQNYKNIDMVQFWAEAMAASKKINPFNVYSREIYQQINQLSVQYTQSSVEQVLISRMFSAVQTDMYCEELFMTNGEIVLELQKLTTKPISQIKIANELKRLGFQRIAKYFSDIKNSKYGYLLYTTTDYSMSYFKDYTEKIKEIF